MRIILSKDGVSREIETPFALCCGSGEIDALISALREIKGGMAETGSPYGWHRVDPSHPSDGPFNTPPRKWTE